jgi:hypothetical protein
MFGSFRAAAGAPSALLLIVIDPGCVSTVYMYGFKCPLDVSSLIQNSTRKAIHRPSTVPSAGANALVSPSFVIHLNFADEQCAWAKLR